MRILVTGASGFIGSLLVPQLSAAGHDVRALGRDRERVRRALARSGELGHGGAARPGGELAHGGVGGSEGRSAQSAVQVMRGDVLSGEGLERALADVEVAYYLVHSMERSHSEGSPFPVRDLLGAQNFAAAAARARVRRIVYLGGLLPRARAHEGPNGTARVEVSRHLASREQVERVLLEAVEDSLALRASIVIGARSRSFRLLVHLVERLPVLALPAWRLLRTQPIDARDVIEMLTACASASVGQASLEIGGPDVLSYGEMLERIAELMLVSRPSLPLGVKLTPITARLAAAIAGEDPELVLALMEGLQVDLLPSEHHAERLLGVRLHSFDAAVEHALAQWEQFEPLAAR